MTHVTYKLLAIILKPELLLKLKTKTAKDMKQSKTITLLSCGALLFLQKLKSQATSSVEHKRPTSAYYNINIA